MRTKNPISSLFGSSPFKPMQAHMQIVKECISEVPKLFDALITADRESLLTRQQTIFDKKKEADVLEHDLFVHLPKGLFMAVDRRDLLGLLTKQSNISGTAQDIAGLMIQRDMSVPQKMVENLQAMVQRCTDSCLLAATIIERLDELIETGFRGREASNVEDMIKDLNTIESETDQMGIELVQILFANEDEMNPVSVMFWYKMIQWVGNLADNAEEVGNHMRLLIAR
ncbi:MAG: TIGR00153 family protein [Pseudomonadota bacterium]